MQIARALALVVLFCACTRPSADAAADSSATATGAVGSQPAATADTASDRRAADRLWAQVAEAFKRGDASAVASLYTEDGAIINEGGEMRGGAAIRSQFAGAFTQTTYKTFDRAPDRFESHGELAIEEGIGGGTTEPKDKSAAPTSSKVRYLAVLKRQPNGGWLFHRVVTVPLSPPAK